MYEPERKMGPLSLAVAVAGGLVVGGILLSAAFWVLGTLAGIVWFVMKLGLLVALAGGLVYGVRYVLSDRRSIDRL